MEGNNFKSPNIEEKRQEFRKYLEVSGVTEKLTMALMKLYQQETKPDDPIIFIRKQLCEECIDEENVTEMKAQISTLVKEKKQAVEDLEISKSLIVKGESEIEMILNTKYQELKADESGNSLLKEYLTQDIFDNLKSKKTNVNGTLLDNIQSGLNHFDQEIGIFASDKNAYDVFEALFAGVLEDFHDIESELEHPDSDWGDFNELEDVDPENNFIKSIYIVISRALNDFEYFPILNVEKLENIEEKIKKMLMKIDDEEFKGAYYSLKSIDDEQKAKWIEDGTLFTNDDKYLRAAETYRCWPKGRGIFINEKNNFRVWINVEEHVQFISSDEGANLKNVYERLHKGFEFMNELNFAKHKRWGYLAHNLKNIGNTMRISVKAKLPKLSLEENSNKFETLLDGNYIKSNDLGGGHFELTSIKKLGVTEIETARDFQKGIKEIITAEKCLYL